MPLSFPSIKLLIVALLVFLLFKNIIKTVIKAITNKDDTDII